MNCSDEKSITHIRKHDLRLIAWCEIDQTMYGGMQSGSNISKHKAAITQELQILRS